MASTTNTRNTCKDCGFFKDNFCVKTNSQARAIFYACERFQTFEQLQAEAERRRKERMDREETRLNFILTGLYISATATQLLLEYFDSFFQDARVERNWRFERKIDTGLYNYRGLQAQATRLKEEYDSRWRFETTPTGRYVIRVK